MKQYSNIKEKHPNDIAYSMGYRDGVREERERILKRVLEDSFFDHCDGCSCDAKKVISAYLTTHQDR